MLESFRAASFVVSWGTIGARMDCIRHNSLEIFAKALDLAIDSRVMEVVMLLTIDLAKNGRSKWLMMEMVDDGPMMANNV